MLVLALAACGNDDKDKEGLSKACPTAPAAMATRADAPGQLPRRAGDRLHRRQEGRPRRRSRTGYLPVTIGPAHDAYVTAVTSAPGYSVTKEEQDVADAEVNFAGAGQQRAGQTARRRARTGPRSRSPSAPPEARARSAALPRSGRSPRLRLRDATRRCRRRSRRCRRRLRSAPGPPRHRRGVRHRVRVRHPGARLAHAERRAVRDHSRPDARRDRQGRLLLHDRRAAPRRRSAARLGRRRQGSARASIVWEGFNPLRRTLEGAREARRRARQRPCCRLRIEVHGGRTTFVNTTGCHRRRVHGRRRPGAARRSTSDELQSRVSRSACPVTEGHRVDHQRGPRATHVRVAVPLRVIGTVGGRRVSATVTGRLHGAAPPGRSPSRVDPQVPAAGSAHRPLRTRGARPRDERLP